MTFLEGAQRKTVNETIEDYWTKIANAAKTVGYPWFPIFLRTDLCSGKHSWKDSCFVPSRNPIAPIGPSATRRLTEHIQEVIVCNETAGIIGLPYEALVFREFIEMDWKFKAFHGDLPISPERRYFIKDGSILCHHPYWAEGAVQDGIMTKEKWEELATHFDSIPKPLPGHTNCFIPNNWQELLAEMNDEPFDEVELLSGYALIVATHPELESDFWSIDFCKARDGTWYLIDCALGEKSYHPSCKFKISEYESGP